MTLGQLKVGEYAQITQVNGQGALRQHLLDMGVIPGAQTHVVKFAPMGDPMEIMIHDYELTLRLSEAEKIIINKIEEPKIEIQTPTKPKQKTTHPYLGEPGAHHDKKEENPLPDDHVLTFALVGNQNCGKTTLFNRLTGSNQHVGNFPGVTVDRKDGAILGYPNSLITDLPGIYSMSPYSNEELVSRNFVLDNRPDAIINIVDATNIERNLYLTMQLLEMDIPMVVAINMMDELIGNGGSIDVNAMEQLLGVPVVPISAAKNQGVDELVIHAIHIAKYQERPLKQDFCSKEDYKGAVHRCLHAAVHLIEDHAESSNIPVRFAASKAIEGDNLIIDKLDLDQNEKEMLEHITIQMEIERGLDRSASIADMRFSFIKKVCATSLKKPHHSKERVRSEKIDQILTGKYTAIPVFLAIMVSVFYLTFNVIGAALQSLLDKGISALSVFVDAAMTKANVNAVLHNLIIDGIFEGVGSVLSFLPIVVTMFFFLSLLEDSGYIARVAFFMDKLLRKLGLSGRSIVPLLIGFGCTVPAVMATRTLPSKRDRKMTILLTPFMSCTAKLPIYAFFVNTFFHGKKGLIMSILYILGIVIGIIITFIFKRFFKGEAVPFVMELPNYRLPTLKTTLQLMWDKAKDFLKKAFTIILLASIIVWFLQSFDLRFNLTDNPSLSIMAKIAGFLAPIFKPLGFGNWQTSTALLSGFLAKENVVSVMEMLFSSQGGVSAVLSPVSAFSLLIFSLLYTPCIAAIASIKREFGARLAIFVVFWQFFIAWVAAFIYYTVASLL